MPDQVSVTQDGVTVTTNTASEAALRAELEPAAAPPATPVRERARDGQEPVAVAERARDEQGRFLKADGTPDPATPAAPAEATPPEATPPEATPPEGDDELSRRHPMARMRQAFKQKAAAEARAAALEAELVRLRNGHGTPPPVAATQPNVLPQGQLAPPQPQPNGHAPSPYPEPQFEQFANEADPYTSYMQAWARWDHATAIAQARTQWEAEQRAQVRAQHLQASIAQGRTQYPDFDQVLTDADTLGLQVSAAMQDAIVDSPRAAEYVYYLATHPEECIRLAEESKQMPVAAAPLMRQLLDAKLGPPVSASHGAGTAVRPVVSTAKPPVTPVGSSPVVSDAPPGDEASAAEHARYWNRRLKVPGTR